MQGLKTVGLLCVALFACAAYAEEEPSAPAQYQFNYAVNEPATGDQKDQEETRNGDDVTGFYRTLDADGYVRTVKYKADAVNGFTAEVTREFTGAAAPAPAPAPSPAVVKAVYKPAPVVAAPAPVIAPAPAVIPAPVAAAPAPVPYVAPSPYYVDSSAYSPSYLQYGYQPAASYSYGYQPYPYAYSAPSYSYDGQYPVTVGQKPVAFRK